MKTAFRPNHRSVRPLLILDRWMREFATRQIDQICIYSFPGLLSVYCLARDYRCSFHSMIPKSRNSYKKRSVGAFTSWTHSSWSDGKKVKSMRAAPTPNDWDELRHGTWRLQVLLIQDHIMCNHNLRCRQCEKVYTNVVAWVSLFVDALGLQQSVLGIYLGNFNNFCMVSSLPPLLSGCPFLVLHSRRATK